METKTVMMPRTLTAENGVKAAMLGEFYSEVEQECPDCDGDGWEDEESGEECYLCKGAGTVTVKVPVSWTTIKEIYRKAVECCGT